jgi:hypothetical protein
VSVLTRHCGHVTASTRDFVPCARVAAIRDPPCVLHVPLSRSHAQHDWQKLEAFLERMLDRGDGAVASDTAQASKMWALRESCSAALGRLGECPREPVSVPRRVAVTTRRFSVSIAIPLLSQFSLCPVPVPCLRWGLYRANTHQHHACVTASLQARCTSTICRYRWRACTTSCRWFETGCGRTHLRECAWYGDCRACRRRRRASRASRGRAGRVRPSRGL